MLFSADFCGSRSITRRCGLRSRRWQCSMMVLCPSLLWQCRPNAHSLTPRQP
jgi:hypothetical protein